MRYHSKTCCYLHLYSAINSNPDSMGSDVWCSMWLSRCTVMHWSKGFVLGFVYLIVSFIFVWLCLRVCVCLYGSVPPCYCVAIYSQQVVIRSSAALIVLWIHYVEHVHSEGPGGGTARQTTKQTEFSSVNADFRLEKSTFTLALSENIFEFFSTVKKIK